ncbi:phosphotransferase family protein [Phenylobacterium sp.]|jgi:aminoglycoside phosphotransferase (APT) family kinase protein|uniref:phosphotransferase family protein n=1 Tax=Phenylobacterium sp. TaxID=1871053 RepID=UPI002E318C0F|nr:phosphotransferase family protein [Phenylobacterium sp.]HEX2561297.1 phosphotransferase family protein [Phenylobacterium sp.]
MDDLAQALNRLAPELASGGAGIEGLTQLSGGASLQTFAFSVMTPDGSVPLILRRRPVALAEGATAAPLATEAALIAAAGARGAPVAQVVRVAGPEDGLGEALVMRRVEGETLGRRIVRGERFADVRSRLARQCGEILRIIHATPPPPGVRLATSDAAGELDRYETAYRASGAERPVLELAFRHLRSHAPPAAEPKLLHGDFRTGNLMVDPERGVVAALDWELSHIGDPAEDLGWLCVNSWRFGAADRPVGGFGDYEDLLAGYGDAAMTRERVRYWQMLGSLKWGVMCLMMFTGAGGPAGEAALERHVIGRRVSETEIDILTLMEGAR